MVWVLRQTLVNIYVAIQGNGAFITKLNSNGERLMGFSISVPDINAIAVDKGGNVFVVGNWDTSWGDHIINPYAGEMDAFVAKFDNNGNMLWNTFLGSTFYDDGYDIAVDNSGYIYVCGSSYASWGDHIINPKSGSIKGTDAFVAKLDSNGNMLWNTFMGAASYYDGIYSSYDYAYAIALDSSGNIYATGYSSSSWGNPISNTGNTFVAKLDNSGNLKWNTFMSGDFKDIAIDENSNIYIAGTCSASWGMPITPHAGGDDACIAKLNISGSLMWNSFVGSSDDDFGNAIVIDGNYNIYLGGISRAVWGNPINSVGSAFVAKFSSEITDITSRSPDGTYIIGNSVVIAVNFSEPFTLNGTLTVKLNTVAIVSIPSFSSSASAVGSYIVGSGESTPQLNATEILLTGTLKDLSGSDIKNIVLPAQNIASTKNIVVDGIAPNMPVISALTPTFNTFPKWTISSGGNGSGAFRYKLDDSALEIGATEITSQTSFDYQASSALSPGYHTLYVQERDAAGNWSAITSKNIQISNDMPPVFGSAVPVITTTPTWTWAGLTGLGGTGHFRIMLDSSDFTTGFTLSDATTFTPANALTQGSHTLYVQEKDTADFWSQTGSAGITIQSPAEAIYVSNNNLLIEEPEGSGEFTVRLAVKPTADVRLEMLSTDTDICMVSPSSVTLTPANWNSGATVTVKDAPFNLVNTQSCNIVFKPAVSNDVYFNGKNTNMVSVTIRDDASFTVYSVQPRYGVEGSYLTVNISGDGFDGNTKVFYKPDGGVETEATRSILGSTIINLTLPDRNQSAPPTAPQRYTLRITDGQKDFSETVFIVRSAELEAIKRKKAIIVAGGGTGYSGDYLWTASRFCTDKANAALQFQGYTQSNIMYLSAGNVKPEKDATVENFRKAVTEWGRQSYYTGYPIDELLIYMTGHGNDGTFTLKGNSDTVLSADNLKLWLDTLQSSSTVRRVILIYDACQSGSFVEKLKNPLYERIILTSANANQSALFADNGKLSFSETFWNTVMNNGRLYRSFKNAEGDMTGMGQFPQIAIPSKYSYTDPQLDLKIGLGLMTAASPIDIRTVSPDVILDCAQNSADIWVENIVPPDGVQSVSAKIRFADQTLTPNMTVHELQLLPDAGRLRYTGRFDSFFGSGILCFGFRSDHER